MKKMTKWLPLTLFALVLAACGTTTPSSEASSAPASSTPTSSTEGSSALALSSITISGANDVTVDFDADFNLFSGVTALGDDSVDYTDELTISSISVAVNSTTGELDTTKTGVHVVRYLVTVGDVSASKFRNVTVSQPISTGMLINPDFSLGTAGWDSGLPYFVGDGALALSTEDGALKADVTAGSNPYEPRIGQANVPFVVDTTYEVSFRAKASTAKRIQVQVGEQYAGAPYFLDFMSPAQIIKFDLTTEWAEYAFTFTHNVAVPVSDPGSLLFALGNVD